MFDLIYTLPAQLEEAWGLAKSLDLRPRGVRWLLICGVGGSGIPGQLLAGLLGGEARVPVITHLDYGLPAWADEEGVCFILSYSGQTQEALSSYEAARARGLSPICITSGGRLLEWCLKNGDHHLKLPSGYPPRAAIGYLFAPLLWAAFRLGLLSDPEPEFREGVAVLSESREELKRGASELASRLLGHLIVVWATSSLTRPVAERFRCQFNENAKVLCHTNHLPELVHNEVAGIGGPKGLTPLPYLLLLSDPRADPRNLRRAELTLKLIQDGFDGVSSISPKGEGRLAHLFSFILFGDLLSYYLACGQGIDPLPIERIEQLKQEVG